MTDKLYRPMGVGALIGLLSICAWGDTPPPAAPAPATPPPSAVVAGACRQDIDNLCKDIKPGEGRIAQCLRANHALLSSGCKEAIRERRREKAATPPPVAPANTTNPTN